MHPNVNYTAYQLMTYGLYIKTSQLMSTRAVHGD